jgi:hypothetical protein
MNTAPDEIQIIQAPVLPALGANIIYSVTLMNGFVVTSPAGFGEPVTPPPSAAPRPLPSQH